MKQISELPRSRAARYPVGKVLSPVHPRSKLRGILRQNKKKILVILGPTATGKTDLALNLSEKIKGEIIACDSRQVYKGLDLGTGKMPSCNLPVKKCNGYWEISNTKIWMYDIADPKIQYSVSDYVKEAFEVINEISKKDKTPVILGGTGFYLRALLDGLSNLSIPSDPKLREELEILSLEQLQNKLKKLFLRKWNLINQSDKQNKRRLIRYLEIAYGSNLKDSNKSFGGLSNKFDILKVGLFAPRETLYQKVDERVVSRLNLGMIIEAQNLHKRGLSFIRVRNLGLEYKVLADYLDGKINSLEGEKGLIKVMQNRIHGYVRRQQTWFKKEKNVFWFDITDKSFLAKVEKLVSKWYYRY